MGIDMCVHGSISCSIPPSLQNASDDRDCENKLVLLLGYDQFQFIKVLIKNRWTVLYCTLLAKTEGEEDRAAIEEEMKADPDKAAVLRVSDKIVGTQLVQGSPQ